MSVQRPFPPPKAWATIERIAPAACTWKCDYHGVDQKARDIVAGKVRKAEKRLEMLKSQMEILEKPVEKKNNDTIYNYDYNIKGISRPKYQAMVRALDNEELQRATREHLKDRQTFLKFPHRLINTCDNSTFQTIPVKDRKAVRSEYEDTISRNGEDMVRAQQQYRQRLPMDQHMP